MTRVLLALALIVAVASSVAGAQTFPNRIELPDGFQPEGIAIAGQQFYVGSIPTGSVYRGDLRTGAGAVLVPAVTGRAAIGMKVSDEFAVPLCRVHHRDLHHAVSEKTWWENVAIAPLEVARKLWQQSCRIETRPAS